MVRHKIKVALFLLIILGMWLGPNLEVHQALAAPKVAKVIYVTMSKACGCTLTRCRIGDRVVDQVFAGARQGLLQRLDYSTEREAVRAIFKKYRVTQVPALLLLDEQGNLLWMTAGELSATEIEKQLAQFGN